MVIGLWVESRRRYLCPPIPLSIKPIPKISRTMDATGQPTPHANDDNVIIPGGSHRDNAENAVRSSLSLVQRRMV